VFTWGVIHHSPDPAAILKEAQHYMRPGTTLKVMVYAANSWKNYMIESGYDQPEAQYGCPVAYTYTENQLISISYFHLGHESMAGNYCIYDPEESARSLGTFTMLLELQMAKRLGKR
jgi:arginyl-tRNA--protein-N-Asp/Glu arginylyltransferase